MLNGISKMRQLHYSALLLTGFYPSQIISIFGLLLRRVVYLYLEVTPPVIHQVFALAERTGANHSLLGGLQYPVMNRGRIVAVPGVLSIAYTLILVIRCYNIMSGAS